jgi:cAMP-binding proteins - catabolite gene activator and regulatory subunit of cAMP-dependent protein kinases
MSTLIIEAALAQHEVTRKHDAGEVIFREGDVPRGVYILRSGSVDLTFASPHGQVRHPRVALPGQILGLVPW